MPRFDLYAKDQPATRRPRPWNLPRILVWTLLFAVLSLWAYSMWLR